MPRIAPVTEAGATEKQRELLSALGGMAHLNVFATAVNHPKLFRSWLGFAGRLLQGSTLPPRDREIVILRVAYLCESPYEWGQHVQIARDAGLHDDEIVRVAEGPDAEGWPAWDALLIRATDELVRDHRLGEGTWDRLTEAYGTEQLIELPMLAGAYAMLAGLLNSVEVETEGPLPAIGSV
jgi:4-carboxymuconolactone decarboxylase